jgi:hypothetical protein
VTKRLQDKKEGEDIGKARGSVRARLAIDEMAMPRLKRHNCGGGADHLVSAPIAMVLGANILEGSTSSSDIEAASPRWVR